MVESYWAAVQQRRRLSRRSVLARSGSVLLGVTGLPAAMSACGSKSGKGSAQHVQSAAQSESPQPGGTLAVPMTTNPPTLDAQRATSFYSLLQSGAVYSRLLRWKTGATPQVAENQDVEPDLAISYESTDAITWTVKLRPDAKYQNIPPVNGHAVESTDVKAAFSRALAPESPFRASLDMLDLAQIQTPDSATVVFKLKYPYAPFQSVLASANYSWIYPREAAAGAFDPAKTMIGSGPFLFDKYTPDVAVENKRNPDWHLKPQPYVNALKWAIMPDTAQQRAQFTGGNLDLAGTSGAITVTSFDRDALVRDNPKARVLRGDPQAGQLLFLPLGDPSSPFQDIRLRRALSMGIDREAIAKAIYNNDAAPQWFAPLIMGKWTLHQDQLPADIAQWYKYDVADAKKLLQASGRQDEQFKLITVTGYIGPEYLQAGETAANMLQSAGFKLTLVQVDYTKDFIGGDKGIRYGNIDKNSIVFAGLTNLSDIDDYLTAYWHSNATAGVSRLSDPKIDDQLGKARTLINIDERVKAYIAIQQYMADQVYAIAGLHVNYAYFISQPRVQNYQSTVGYGAAAESWAKIWLRA